LGIVYGAPSMVTGTVDQPIGRHPVERKKMAIVSIEKGGRRAVTHWQIQERLGNFTLMQFQLETGRTHQIRVHSAAIGHPIVGDPVYGAGRSVGVNLTGQALHAWKLRLQHPISEEWIEAIAPPPPDFNTLLQVLRQRLQ
jgi:23S rRNA pseudouridine1911/1915/1917 synthase